MPSPLAHAHLSAITLAGMRPRTITARAAVLDAFERGLDPRHLADATRLDIEAYLSRPLAPESRRTYRSHLRGFYRWCVEEELLSHDPTERVRPIRVPRGVPRPVSDEELSVALTLADRRMRCWLLLMALAGLRCMEVAALEPRDLLNTSTGPILHMRVTKGGSPATVPLHDAVVTALRQQPIRNGLWWEVSAGTLSTQVNRYLRGCGVRGTAHSLRHHAGTMWYEASGRDMLTTAALMRHARIDTTAIYAKLSSGRPAEVARSVRLRAVS